MHLLFALPETEEGREGGKMIVEESASEGEGEKVVEEPTSESVLPRSVISTEFSIISEILGSSCTEYCTSSLRFSSDLQII
jgi:hypothetical protein